MEKLEHCVTFSWKQPIYEEPLSLFRKTLCLPKAQTITQGSTHKIERESGHNDMPSRIEESIPSFPDDVPTANIYTVDFDRLKDGDPEEARKVYEASRGYGFFYLSNTHVDYDFMFDLANETFKLPLDEKMKYEMGNTGRYFGYKMSGSNYVDSKGTPDQSEFYNVSKDDVMGNGQYKEHPLEHPSTIERRRGELEGFMSSAHRVVLVVLKVLSEQLGLGPDVLPDLHKLDRVGGDQARVTHAPPVSADTITLGEHTGECD